MQLTNFLKWKNDGKTYKKKMKNLKTEFWYANTSKIFSTTSNTTKNIFDYGTRKIRLLGYEVKYISGDFKLNDHDEIAWITRNEFKNYDFAPADLPIVAAIKAPTTSKAAGAAVA